MKKIHTYTCKVEWTGNTGSGTTDYRTYQRSHDISIPGKPILHASSDVAFRGDATKYNPEDFLLMSISSCHMLWYLHLCADAGVIVIAYEDHPVAEMEDNGIEGGHFIQATLHPQVTVSEVGMIEKANALHAKAHHLCFISNSLNFPVKIDPRASI